MAHEWRSHPSLKARFHKDFPDDLQVIVHDGGPRLTTNRPELIWVRLTATRDVDLFVGTALNQPTHLKSVALGQQILCLVEPHAKYPVLATTKYLAERKDWQIHGCQKCGFGELFDAPSDLMQAIFPEAPPGGVIDAFTSFCPMCGGVQLVKSLRK